MITVAILINGNPIMARSAVNTGCENEKGEIAYRVDDGSEVIHNPEDGAVELALKLLATIQEYKGVALDAVLNEKTPNQND